MLFRTRTWSPLLALGALACSPPVRPLEDAMNPPVEIARPDRVVPSDATDGSMDGSMDSSMDSSMQPSMDGSSETPMDVLSDTQDADPGADGAEIAFIADPAPPRCSGDPATCPSRNNTAARCVSGQCRYACTGTHSDCNDEPADGCETETASNNMHCGACGRVCVSAQPGTVPRCARGTCTSVCDTGFVDCDRTLANGCEINASNNPRHCGACDNACAAPPGTTATCSSGRCGFTCTPGRSDCDLNSANGCEVNSSADVSHCGACNNACPVPANATATCAANTCGIACLAGFSNCDGSPANGCETRGACP